MATRMLIDASHEEETRVVIVKGTRLEEFDYETVSKKQLKGNIYLAKVTRVEPSLQAAFVEYGGNRHGFLPFNEIHPDYYQLPIADREALIEQETAEELEASDADDGDPVKTDPPEEASDGESAADDADADTETAEAAGDGSDADADDNGNGDDGANGNGDSNGGGRVEVIDRGDDDYVESVGGDDDIDDPRPAPRRHYKIQEVIKRRQILLVQVVKEERGNKGAALTTYISLPGRYSVLMPNSGRGGGISRKISAPADRKRLKKIAQELDVPKGIGVIIRTAGLSRTKVEIKRDYEFLMRLWDDIRELTLKSIAPYCVYEEANLIKRCIRDLYDKDISEVLVEGEEGYKVAKDFMRKLMPSHAKKVQPYKDKIPLFHRFQVEQQFASMYHPEVQLKSGGYIVINPTEALVSIDVNSGKATRERNVEDTAVKTNLEAAEEIARQLRLRDLAGLIVIDFIDMDDNRNNRAVERRMKDCLKSDRARIQVGRISPFGLMELSRQRLRPSFLESSTTPCQICGGSGFVRSIESTALLIIRMLEEEGVRERSSKITVSVHTEVAIYLLNQKRAVIQNLENLYGMTILILADPTINMNDYNMEREKGRPGDLTPITRELPTSYASAAPEEEDEDDEHDHDHDQENGHARSHDDDEDGSSSRRRRRRRRRKPREENGVAAQSSEDQPATEAESDSTEHGEGEEGTHEPKRRRRGKRGGRRRSRGAGSDDQRSFAEGSAENGDDVTADTLSAPDDTASDETASDAPVTIPITVTSEDAEATLDDAEAPTDAESDGADSDAAEPSPEEAAEAEVKKPRRTRRKAPVKSDEAPASDETADETPEAAAETAEEAPAEAAEAKKKAPARRRRVTKKVEAETADADAPAEAAPEEAPVDDQPALAASEADAAPAADEDATAEPAASEEEVVDKPVSVTVISEDAREEVVIADAKPKRGWWRRN
ncbi:ribonuclease E/G [Sneathiella sp.]|uniref:ribonuclease E/G n=1 Tax=Sneathiella sp. TaxID=1964365 RepID=UPI002FE322C7